MLRRLVLACSVALPCALLPACAQGVNGGAKTPATSSSARKPSGTKDPTGRSGKPDAAREPRVLTDPAHIRLARIEGLLLAWDRAQGSGRAQEAEGLAAGLRSEVDAGDADVRAAFDGTHGLEARHLATLALGFSSAPDATARLVERVREDGEPRLVANGLLALRVRRDPATPLLPLAYYVGSEDPSVRRYAPLALAHVLEARRAAGVPADTHLEQRVLPVLAAKSKDRDAAVRLHVARALGALQIPGTTPVLLPMLKDHRPEVALGAASALARRGEREGMIEVVRLLSEAPTERRAPIAQALVLYAENLTGAPLPPAERERLGAAPGAWLHWHAAWEKQSRR